MNKGHRYRVTVEALPDPADAGAQPEALTFETLQHDDLLAIVRRARALGGFLAEEAERFVVGLKLLSEPCLRHRQDEFVRSVDPAVRQIVLTLKERVKRAEGAAPADGDGPGHGGL